MKQKLIPLPRLKKQLDKLWSERVRTRDGKCVLCGKTGKGLQAHHYIKSRARSLKYRWDIRNGITLCYGCHIYAVHMTASFEIVNKLLHYATTHEILTLQDVADIINDPETKDLRNDRAFIEACRVDLEGQNE